MPKIYYYLFESYIVEIAKAKKEGCHHTESMTASDKNVILESFIQHGTDPKYLNLQVLWILMYNGKPNF